LFAFKRNAGFVFLLIMRKLFQLSFWSKVWKNKFKFNEYGNSGFIEKGGELLAMGIRNGKLHPE
jgi:hypothetical protein